jgi:hypothetical protein
VWIPECAYICLHWPDLNPTENTWDSLDDLIEGQHYSHFRSLKELFTSAVVTIDHL